MEPSVLNAQVIGQLLLMQNALLDLPDEKAVYDFVCRGLAEVPGVSAVRFREAQARPENENDLTFPLCVDDSCLGRLMFTISDPVAFAPYYDHLSNFCLILAHHLEERAIRRQNHLYQSQLEEMVQDRTRELRQQIDENRRANEELRLASEKWRLTFDAMLDPVAYVFPDGAIQQCNRAFADFCGRNIKTLKGQKCFFLIHHSDMPVHNCPMFRACRSKKRETMELAVEGKTLFVVAEPIFAADGEVKGVVHILRDITDQKRDKEALEESNNLYRMVAQTAHDYILTTDLNHVITFANRAVRELAGNVDLVGLKVSDLTLPENHAKQEELMNKRREGNKEIFSFEWRLKDYAGRFLIMDVRSQLLTKDDRPTGVLFVARDITEHVEAADKLRILNERYQLAALAAGIGVWDRDLGSGRVIWDDRMYALYGVTRDQITLSPETWRDMIHPDDKERVDRDLQSLIRNEKYSDTEFRILWPDGRVHYIKSYGMVQLDSAGQPARIIGVNYDVTWRKQAEEERMALEKQLFDAQKMEAVGTLAGGIAHDFNNILAAIMGYAELAKESQVDNLRERNIRQLLLSAGRAKDLVNQILSFSRRVEHDKKQLDLKVIIKEEIKMLRATMPSTIEIRQVIDNKTYMVNADVTQMHQVVMNLCTNAAHAMGEKGGSMEIRLTEEIIADEASADALHLKPGTYIKLSISDTGPGIDPGIIGRIFEPFFTTKKVGEGTGLGLSVVYGIIKHHEGAVRVESTPGQGAAFYIYLPRIEDVPAVMAAAESDMIPHGRERILFVDDEKDLTDLAMINLTRLGYQVTICQDSRDALKMFQANPDAFDLIITDMTMPHLSGSELVKQVIKLRPHQSIILCTGFSTYMNAEKATDLGIKTFLYKPVSKRDLAIAIRKTLDEHDSASALH